VELVAAAFVSHLDWQRQSGPTIVVSSRPVVARVEVTSANQEWHSAVALSEIPAD